MNIILGMNQRAYIVGILGILSILIILLDLIAIWNLQSVEGGGLIVVAVLFPIIFLICLFWIIGYSLSTLRKSGRLLLMNTVLYIGIFFSTFVFVFSFAEQYGVFSTDFTGWFPLPYSFLMLTFFLLVKLAISIANRKKKKSEGRL